MIFYKYYSSLEVIAEQDNQCIIAEQDIQELIWQAALQFNACNLRRPGPIESNVRAKVTQVNNMLQNGLLSRSKNNKHSFIQ